MSRTTMLVLGVAGLALAGALTLDMYTPVVEKTGCGHAIDNVRGEDADSNSNGTPSQSPAKTPPPLTPERVDFLADGRPDAKGLREMYLAAEKEKERRMIERANRDVYRGSDSASSKRLYLQQQAYRRSRELTPVVPINMVIREGASASRT